jgi:hypothetical protein
VTAVAEEGLERFKEIAVAVEETSQRPESNPFAYRSSATQAGI